MKDSKDNKVVELYNRMYKFIEKMIQEDNGPQETLENFFENKLELFKRCLLESIELLCKENREFLVNEGYFRYLYYSHNYLKRFSKIVSFICYIDNLKHFGNDDWQWPYIVEKYFDYLYFMISVQNNPSMYDKKFNINNFLNNETDKELMVNYNNYKNIHIGVTSSYTYLKLKSRMICFVYVYSYINKINIDLKSFCENINFDEMMEYLELNGIEYNFDRNKEKFFFKLCYEYIIDKHFNKEKRLIKGNK